jgi:transposase-like protein
MINYKILTPEEIKSMFRQSRIIKIYEKTLIKKFWLYFEEFIKRFKGISEEEFFYYLKEAEFRFNNYKIELKNIIYTN